MGVTTRCTVQCVVLINDDRGRGRSGADYRRNEDYVTQRMRCKETLVSLFLYHCL